MQMYENRFASKLTFHFRCAIFSDHRSRGTPYPILAMCFNVNEQTIGKICRCKPTGLYSSVYKEFDKLGPEEMFKFYVNQGGLRERIDEAAYKYKLGTLKPGEHYQADGPGVYWLKDSHRNRKPITIRHADEIKRRNPDSELPDGGGWLIYLNKFNQWGRLTEQPWETIEEVLRYLAAFPEELD